MKKIIVTLTLILLLASPIAVPSAHAAISNTKGLPVFTGNINDPGVVILEEGDGYIIVEIDGEFYIVYTK